MLGSDSDSTYSEAELDMKGKSWFVYPHSARSILMIACFTESAPSRYHIRADDQERPYVANWTPAHGLDLSPVYGAMLLYNPAAAPEDMPKRLGDYPRNVHISDFVLGYIVTVLKAVGEIDHERLGSSFWKDHLHNHWADTCL